MEQTTEDVLAAMQRIGVTNEAKAREIGEASGVEKHAVLYHLHEHLIPGGFAEISGSVSEGLITPIHQYTLTEAGDEIDTSPSLATLGVVEEQVSELQAEVATLREELNVRTQEPQEAD